MSIFATPQNKDSIIQLMQRMSTKVHNLVFELQGMNSALNQMLDADINAMFEAGGMTSQEAAQALADLRSWQTSCQQIIGYYTGSDNPAYQIEKRVIL